jgi:hypothetical protein
VVVCYNSSKKRIQILADGSEVLLEQTPSGIFVEVDLKLDSEQRLKYLE